MGTPNGSGTGGRLRTTGLALLGLALIAVVIGVVVAVARDGQTTATEPSATGTPATGTPGTATPGTGPPPATPPPAPSSAPPAPSVIPFPPPVPSIPAGEPEVAAPSSPDDAAGALGGDKGISRGEVRVLNNSTIRGLAARAARDLTAAGWTVIEIGNYAAGTIPTTTAYYQEGTDQRAAAETLGEHFKMRVEPRFPGIANASPGLIVIITKDYVSP